MIQHPGKIVGRSPGHFYTNGHIRQDARNQTPFPDGLSTTASLFRILHDNIKSCLCNPQGNGPIVKWGATSHSGIIEKNIFPGASMEGNAGQPNYSAAKGGIVGFTKSCALALGRYGVTVNALSPQADTRMWQAVTPERAREMGVMRGLVTKEEAAAISDEEVTRRIFGSSEDIAPIIVYLASDLATNINGQIFFASGGRISLYGASTQIKTIYKKGTWTFEELASVVPGSLASGLVNPAPPEPPASEK
jgi:NAD(P)-dependent dehydrogenase (short-subunit alcohol dehydrogenase family)